MEIINGRRTIYVLRVRVVIGCISHIIRQTTRTNFIAICYPDVTPTGSAYDHNGCDIRERTIIAGALSMNIPNVVLRSTTWAYHVAINLRIVCRAGPRKGPILVAPGVLLTTAPRTMELDDFNTFWRGTHDNN